jgi:hypothetical protein
MEHGEGPGCLLQLPCGQIRPALVQCRRRPSPCCGEWGGDFGGTVKGAAQWWGATAISWFCAIIPLLLHQTDISIHASRVLPALRLATAERLMQPKPDGAANQKMQPSQQVGPVKETGQTLTSALNTGSLVLFRDSFFYS